MDLEFQIYDYRETHINLDEDSEVETMGEYVVQVFGRTMDGKSVYAKLTNFQPRFYIGIPQKWSNREISRMEKYLKSSENKSIWKMHRDCLTKVGLVKKKKAYGFTNNKIFKYAVLFFTNLWACKKFSYLFEHRKVYIPGVTSKGLKFNIYESNLAPLIRCFHIQDIPGCGWVKSDSHTLVDKSEKESICDYEIMLPYTNLLPIEKDCNAPLRICSFDIECYSYDGMFPQARRSKDKIIQIGSTYNYLGNKEIYRQHIVTLDTCNKIEGAVVESFDNEKDLLRGWVNEIKSHDVDILTGYNIFYFDEKYIYDRAKLLNIDFDVSYMSKLNTYKCKFLEQKLASSALGENILKYYDTPGIVHIDLMKDVQKTYKLESYKLDKVAGSFIKGEVESIKKVRKNKYELYCKKITDLRKDDYIHLELQESYVSEDIGEKFPIYKLDLEKNIITLKTDLDLVEECDFERGKVFWSQAKDDVPPKMIFKMQTMGPKERCIVAKYCLKDCILVNLLVEKLQVVTKNIEMANVCYVPLSYIFVRGQGVKLFSLCLKEFRKSGFIFPVMRKPEEDLGKYEGAIVFDPIPAVNYQAFAVKDYASLYPSSIIHKNMSHETKVDNPEYDNLEEVEYFNAQFVDNEGNINYRRYAKLKGEYGMVPKILQNLLGERKAVKKLMKTEKDNFKYGILDAKQLALKITANSLYGQLGASTSPVRERDTAACTTSTGREMLILAKKYDEEILPWMINGLQIAYMNGDSETVDNIYKKELKDCEDEKLKEKIEKFCKRTEGLVFNPIVKYGDTDSIFSCYQYRKDNKEISDKKTLSLLKKIMRFGKDLLGAFIPKKDYDMYSEIYDKYYGEIKSLKLPTKLKVKPIPEHNEVVLPIEDRLKQLVKEYVEESYFPWLWTLHDMFALDLSYLDASIREEIVDIRLFKWGNKQIGKIRIEEQLFSDVDKYDLILRCRTFCNDILGKHYLVPYWKYKKNKLEYRVKITKNGELIKDKSNLDYSVELGIISGDTIKSRLALPQDLEYEKTFWPYLILTKKRYVGNKYEFDLDKFKFDFMGIVLKRRDNAPIVKEICSGIINKLIVERDPEGAYKFLEDCLTKMFNDEYNIKYFLQSRTLKAKESYVNWTRIAHVVLAERIGERDPGNKPQPGDRIMFAAIEVEDSKHKLQGDRIEIPEYIKEKGLKVDYFFYLTNQIEKPALQFLKLAIPNVEKRLDDFKIIMRNKRDGIKMMSEFIEPSKMIDNYLEGLYEF